MGLLVCGSPPSLFALEQVEDDNRSDGKRREKRGFFSSLKR